jgi:hypothetical protein
MKKRCSHRSLIIHTEKDRCSWVECTKCKAAGPAKHSITLALLAWIIKAADQPRGR